MFTGNMTNFKAKSPKITSSILFIDKERRWREPSPITTMTITKQKETILNYLYQYRFLNRNQIQQLLNHKKFNQIILWLNELTKNKFIKRYYNPKTVTVPAVYSLGSKGRSYLKQNAENLEINPGLLNRIWKEPTLSLQFRWHCQFIADCFLSLTKLTQATRATLHYLTKTKLYGMEYMFLPNPDAYFSITETNKHKKCFFLDIFDDLPVRMILRKRIRQYFQYFATNDWQDHNKNPFPTIIFVCPDTRSYNYLNKFIKKQLEEEPQLSFFLALRDIVKIKGINKETIQKIEPNP